MSLYGASEARRKSLQFYDLDSNINKIKKQIEEAIELGRFETYIDLSGLDKETEGQIIQVIQMFGYKTYYNPGAMYWEINWR